MLYPFHVPEMTRAERPSPKTASGPERMTNATQGIRIVAAIAAACDATDVLDDGSHVTGGGQEGS